MSQQAITDHREEQESPGETSRPLQIITVGGGKGGIGKSVICCSLGVALAECGARVIVVDADLGGANLHTVMGLYLPSRTLHDFITRKVKTLGEIVLPTAVERLQLICGAPGIVGFAQIEYWEKMKLIRHLRKLEADFVLVDIGAGMSLNEIDLFNAGDIPIVVVNPEPTSIQECYNFIKVAVFRRLRRVFSDSPMVVELLNRCKDPSHVNDRRLLAEIGKETLRHDQSEGARFFDVLNEFSPRLILNRVFDQKEIQDGLALQIAAQDLLSIRLEYWGHLNYDPLIKKAVREMRLPDILAASAHRQTLLAMVRQHVLGEKNRQRQSGAAIVRSMLGKSNNANGATRICSIQCRLWGHCDLQEGGLPCRVPDEIYNQRLSGTETKSSATSLAEVRL